MNLKIHAIIFFGYCIFIFSNITAENQKSYGNIDFPSSVSPEFNSLFIKGVLLLHNFQYNDARKVFLELQEKDPEFVLGYWGEAMTYNHPLWDEQDLEEGRRVLNKLGSLPEQRISKAKTPIEKGFIHSINNLYGPKETKKERDFLYASALMNLYQNFPQDDEVATFYALALLGKEQGNRNYAEYMKAASVANDVFIRNPQHPGAMHYLIHSVDDPIHAPLGINAARAYSLIAPDAPHAAHMPSHIFLALGLWDEVVKSNQKAWDSAKKHIELHSQSFESHDNHALHALQWLHYAHLQLGQLSQANELLKLMYQMTSQSNLPIFKWYYAQMRSAQAVALENDPQLTPSVDMKDIELSAVANNFYAEAVLSILEKQDLNPLIDRLKKLLELERQKFDKQPEPGKDYFTSTRKDGLTTAEVVILQLTALNERMKNQMDQAFKSLNEAVILEEKLPQGYGPPIPSKPSKELLGEFLLNDGQFSKACQVLQKVLLEFPNRREAIQLIQKIDKNYLCPMKTNIFFHRLLPNTQTAI